MNIRLLQTILRSATATGSVLFVLAAPALASLDEEAKIAGDMVRGAIVRLDAQKIPDQRASILKDAVEALSVLEGLASASVNNKTAKQRLNDLKDEAVTPDVLRLSFVEALSAAIVAGDAGLKLDLQAKSVVERIVEPAYRSAAWSQLARTHLQLKQSSEAERLAMRAIEEARSIERKATRNGAMRSAILVFPFDGKHAGIVETATNAMTNANARSEIYRMEALALLGDDRKFSQDQLVEMSRKSIESSDYEQALRAVRAMERDDPRRASLLGSILDVAVKASDETLALKVVKSMARDRDQDRALRTLVNLRLKRDKPVRAKELIALMLTNGGRIDGEIAIAKSFDQQGYSQAAIDTLKSLSVSPAEDPDGAADLASAFAGLSAYAEARRLADAITDPARRSFAFSRLSKRLADDQRISEARKALEQVTEADDLAFARSGLARALVKSGKLDEARSILRLLPQGPDRDRVLEELAKRQADAGDLNDLRGILDEIYTAEARSHIRIILAGALTKTDRKAARVELEHAKNDLTSGADSAQLLADVAVAYVKLDEQQAADDVLSSISDTVAKGSAESRIVDILISRGSLDAAAARFSHLPEKKRFDAVAQIALARFREHGNVETFVSSVKDLPFQARIPALRTMSEARAHLLDKRKWLEDPDADPLAPITNAPMTQKANFALNRHIIQAPVPSTRSLTGIKMPDIFSMNAGVMRSRMPAPAQGVAHLAILGFSPFSVEAFKLTDSGTPAIYQAQVSQQRNWPQYIAIEKGVVSLGSLLRDLPELVASNLLVDKGDVLLVRVPIIVLPGATLLMSGAEFSQYQLGAQSGAFIAVDGNLVIQDADIVGYDEEKNAPAAADEEDRAIFRPFITAWSGSNLEIAGSRLAMLGYDASKAFGLTQSSGAAIQSLYAIHESPPKGNIIDNTFENLRYGYYSYEAVGVQLIGNEYRDNIVYGIDPHDRSHNLLIALNTAYGSQKKHGIIVSREVNDSFIVGNVSLHNKGSGFMLDRSSLRNIVYANTSVANDGDGLTFYESGCNIAAANDFSRNKRAGIKVRNSTDVGMYDNTIINNKASGADIYISDLQASQEGQGRDFELDPFQQITTTVISGNLFAANGNAVNVDGAAQTILEANNFRDQRSGVYGGDLLALSPYLLQLGETSPTLIGMVCQPKTQIDACHINGWRFQQKKEMACGGVSQPFRTGVDRKVKRING